MKQRILYLDIIRVIACIMVICMHTPMTPNLEGDVPAAIRAFMVYSSYWTLPCVCMFFAVSGALLLPAKIEPSESGQWLKKRLNKVIWPTLIWTFFYLIISFVNNPENAWGGVIRQVVSIPFNRQGHGILWFMYTLVGLYLVTPVISPWIQKSGKRTLQMYLGLWTVTLCYPALTAFVEINETPYGILYYFSGFLGYFVLGYFLHTYGLKGNTLWYIVALICLMPLMLIYKMFVEGRFAFGEELFWYLGPICPLMLVCWWKLCTAVAGRIHNKSITSFIAMVSNLSFGVYLVHIFCLYSVAHVLFASVPNYYMQTFCSFVFTLSSALAISYLISFLPFGDYIIGYKRQR